jgi:RES domain-containing protein
VILWRISDYVSLDGGGGLKWSARWHTAGRRIVYCAPNPATALLEVLVHTEISIDDLPVNFSYLEIEAPDSLTVEDVDTDRLGRSWQTDLEVTRRAGDDWLQSSRTSVLRVPSVIVPATWNILINPNHASSRQIRVLRIHNCGFDTRLLRSS